MYVVILNVTLAVYMFMIYYPQWYIPYLSPLLFVMWWVVITYEYNQWDNSSAWMWVFAPILILPIYTMVFGLLTSTNQMFAIMYLVLGLYAVTYYTWSMYNASGTLPFGLHKKLEDIANYESAMDDRNSGKDKDMPRNGGLYRNVGATPYKYQNMDGLSERLMLIQEEFKLLHEEIGMYGGQRRPAGPQNTVEQHVKQPILTRKLAKGLYKKLVSKSTRKTKNEEN